MVSKIAVVALVVIVAAPIFIGYGMNFETVETTEYSRSVWDTDVTSLLKNASNYTYVSADTSDMNTNHLFLSQIVLGDIPFTPIYMGYGSTYTSLAWRNSTYNIANSIGSSIVSNMWYYNMTVYYNNDDWMTSGNYYTLTVVDTHSNTTTYDRVVALYYEDGQNLEVWFYNNVGLGAYSKSTVSDPYSVNFVKHGSPAGSAYQFRVDKSDNTTTLANAGKYIDIAKGFKVQRTSMGRFTLEPPTPAKSVLMTFDLDTLSSYYGAGTYRMLIDPDDEYTHNNNKLYSLTRYHEPGIYRWAIEVVSPDGNGDLDIITTTYLDAGTSGNNCYQLLFTESSLVCRYVGAWNLSIGPAQSYRNYVIDEDMNLEGDIAALYFEPLTKVDGESYYRADYTPTMRVDDAQVRGLTYGVFENVTYSPASTRPNSPSTIIQGVSQYGSSLVFGGHTYTVTNGNIQINGHDIPIEGIRLESTPNGANWDNSINGTVVSTSATPSTITFNGKWNASVNVSDMTEKTGIETKWVPGKFAWDGLDDNFLMAGLMASIAAFIGLAMYGRRSGAKVLPLLLICGGAAFLFLLML